MLNDRLQRAVTILILAITPQLAQSQTPGAGAGATGHPAHGAGFQSPEVVLRDDLGTYSREITTSSERARAYFNQGLRLEYAFNHEHAIRSYEAAIVVDPHCAMCWWGIALASGPNINAPITEQGGLRAFEAIRRAEQESAGVTAVEQDLIRALSTRYGERPLEDREQRDAAYAESMGQLAERYPADADVLTLYGAALMNLNPWNYWEGDYGQRTPRAGTPLILRMLERALELSPSSPGACHYYIHAVEAGEPEKAVSCAERLGTLIPGAGHIVHMPGHIYIRVGRYADAVSVNEHAVHSDEAHLSGDLSGTLYAGTYYPHNYHFMGFAATMAGMSERAIRAARTVAPKITPEIARDFYWIQNAVVLPQLTNLTFGRWEDVLAESAPPGGLEQSSLLSEYAKGVALAALGQIVEAESALEAMRMRTENLRTGDPAMNPIPHLAPEVLAGEIALRSGDAETAVRHFRRAVELEDGLLYDEPPLWYYPIRHSLGRALLEAGRPEEAEIAYREDLDRFPENGWSLFGLATSLDAQGRSSEADRVWSRFEAAWTDADVELPASRF